jgi:hypothetical protein
MECSKCHSKWEINQKAAVTLTACPFCGVSLVNGDKPVCGDTSKEALVVIMDRFGVEVLLGRLNAYFSDIAPSVPANVKGLVYSVYEKGAAQILKSNLNASKVEKELAVKKAIAKLTEAFIVQEMAENIIYEFTSVLGWPVSKPLQSSLLSKQLTQQATDPDHTSIQPNIQQSPKYVAMQSPPKQSVPKYFLQKWEVSPTVVEIVPKILQGERRNLLFGNYRWRVLDVQGDKALIITEKVIESHPYDVKGESAAWKSCSLRKYLNEGFYNKFDNVCKAQMLTTTLLNPGNKRYGTSGCSNTQDHIFLLSIDEVEKYFINNAERRTDSISGKIWWLRSPGRKVYEAALVYVFDGDVSGSGAPVDHNGGVRPALWLKLKS